MPEAHLKEAATLKRVIDAVFFILGRFVTNGISLSFVVWGKGRKLMYSQVVVPQCWAIISASRASGFSNVLKLGETKTHPSVVTIYFKDVCESLADLSQTFNAAIEILQQKDGVSGVTLPPSFWEAKWPQRGEDGSVSCHHR